MSKLERLIILFLIAGPLFAQPEKSAWEVLKQGLAEKSVDKHRQALTATGSIGTAPEAVQRSRSFRITAEQCAEAIARGVERNARTVVTPRAGWLFIIMERLFPRLVDAQMERMNAVQGTPRPDEMKIG